MKDYKVDWDAWIEQEREAIEAARGTTRQETAQQEVSADKEETAMARPKNSDIRMWWHTPWWMLTDAQKAQTAKLYRSEHGDYDAAKVGAMLGSSSNLTLVQAIGIAADAQKHTDTLADYMALPDTAPAQPTETGSVADLPEGSIVDALPASIRVRKEPPTRTHASLALANPGRWVLHRVMRAKDGASWKRARGCASAIRSGHTKAFAPRGRFDASVVEVAEGVWQVWVHALDAAAVEAAS